MSKIWCFLINEVRKRFRIYSFIFSVLILIFTFYISNMPLLYINEVWLVPSIWIKCLLLFAFLLILFFKYYLLFRVGKLFDKIIYFFINVQLDLICFYSLFLLASTVFFDNKIFNVIVKNSYSIIIIFLCIFMLLCVYLIINKAVTKTKDISSLSNFINRIFIIIFISSNIIFVISIIELIYSQLIGIDVIKCTVSGLKSAGEQNFLNLLYFNSIAFFGVGFGDFIPIHPLSKTLTIFETLLFYLNTFIILGTILYKGGIKQSQEKHYILRPITIRNYLIVICVWLVLAFLYKLYSIIESYWILK